MSNLVRFPNQVTFFGQQPHRATFYLRGNQNDCSTCNILSIFLSCFLILFLVIIVKHVSNSNDNLKYSLQLTMDAALVNKIELKSALINALAGHL